MREFFCDFRVHHQIHPTDFLLIICEMGQSVRRMLAGVVAGELNAMHVTMAAVNSVLFWQT